MSPDLTKTKFNIGLFLRLYLSKVCQTVHDYNLARGLPICCRFDNLELVSKSQVFQKRKLQFVLWLLYS